MSRMLLRLFLRGLSRSLPFAFCLAVACASNAPGPGGSVNGLAVDNNQAPLPGITVSLKSPAGKLVDTVTTAGDGSYSFQNVAPGQYQVVSVFAGFSTPSPLNVTVAAGPVKLRPLVLLTPDQADSGLSFVTPTPAPQ